MGNEVKEISYPTADSIYEAIKHGDEQHKAWLKQKLNELFNTGEQTDLKCINCQHFTGSYNLTWGFCDRYGESSPVENDWFCKGILDERK